MEQYNLSPLLPHREEVSALLFPHPVYMPHPISTWPPSHSLYPEYKSGLRTPVQRRFSLELARCSNSVSHSNKLHFPLILSHVWKFFSNPRPDHDIFGGLYRDLGVSSPTSSLLLSHRDPLRTGKWKQLRNSGQLTLWCVPKASLRPIATARTGEGLSFVFFPTEG